MGIEHDPFAGVNSADLETRGENSTKIEPVLKTEKPTESAPREFKPAAASSAADRDVMPIDPEDIFNFAESKFTQLAEAKKQGGEIERENVSTTSGRVIQTNNSERTLNSTEIMSPEMIEISAVMFVEIYGLIITGVCQWFSGVENDYSFDKKLKERFEKITAMYFEVQNIRLTPTHFFFLMMFLVSFGPGVKAYKDRNRRIKAESFKVKTNRRNEQRKQGEQTTLFETEPVVKGRLYYAAAKDEDGVVWYTRHPLTNEYAKKNDRERVPPELETFILDFKEKNNAWPTKKQVDVFLTQP